jgi:hypothetical protein
MHPFIQFWRLSPTDRRLLLGAAGHLIAAHLRLVMLPLRVLLRGAGPRKGSQPSRGWTPQEIAWAVCAASGYLPWPANCLAQALAGQAMLAQQGLPAQLRFGVAKGASGELHAHAWLECAGQAIIGAGAAAHCLPLPDWPADDRP